MSRSNHRIVPALLAALLAGLLLALILPAASATAATYRYWGYYQLSGDTWQFAAKGPDQTKPADGAVEGWRFAVGTEGSTRFPRVSVTFDDVCKSTKAVDGKKRVAVVIDYGRQADTEDNSEPPSPVAHCASVAGTASGAEVLSSVADVRVEKGLVCGIDDQPATGCGGEVKSVSAKAKAPDTPVTLASENKSARGDKSSAKKDDDGNNATTYLGVIVIALIATGLGIASLRRRNRT